MPRCGGVPYPRRAGGGRPLWLSIRDALLARYETYGYPTGRETVHYVRVVALARSIAATYGTATRLSHARDPFKMHVRMLERWERMLRWPSSGDELGRRERLAKRFELEGLPAVATLLEEELRTAVGDTFVSLQRCNPEVAVIHVPDNTYPFGTVVPGVTWSSTVGRLLAFLEKEQNDTDAAFYEKAGRVIEVLDAEVSAWTEIDWYRAPGGPYGVGTDVAGGPVQAGFYLDDDYNLDNCVFDDTGGPDEWAAVVPYRDWDPANATSGAGDILTALPDSSGHGRDAEFTAGGAFPFTALPGPVLLASSAYFGGAPSLEYRCDPATDPAPTLLATTNPAGPFSVAIVLYSDCPTGPGPSFPTNNYAVSTQDGMVSVYAAGAGDRAWHAWGSPDFTELTPSVDFASTPTVLLITSTGESSPGANDATVRYYARSLTPSSVTGKPPITAKPWLLGGYGGDAGYTLQGEVARFIVWDSDMHASSATILAALGAKYGITILP